jgi:NAD+ synthase (glutamine-hydrolysing)
MIAGFGYVRVGAAVPQVRPAAVDENVCGLLALAREAADAGCDVVLFPELGLSGYTCADLFAQRRLQDACLEGLARFAEGTARFSPFFVVGVPLAVDGLLFNVAAAVCRGEIVGLVPKTFIPAYHEYYECRWFAAEGARRRGQVDCCGQTVPFGADLVFRPHDGGDLCIGIELCEDLWAPVPPSSHLALAGVTLLLNLSASNELVGKSEYRLELVRQQSARCLAAYAYCSAGVGESTTDMVFGGDSILAENGVVLARGERFRREPQLTMADMDTELLRHERLACNTFAQAVTQAAVAGPLRPREVRFAAAADTGGRTLRRPVSPHPFIPQDPSTRHDRCQEIFAIQSTGLATRLAHTRARDVVIGLSGGLDSTLALLVSIEAFERLGLPRPGIHAITMPGFGTSQRTRGNVDRLCESLGLPLETIPIADSCRQHLADIGHDGTLADVAYENAQARERTQVLMDRANMLGGLVVGTGDLSELALGWCTYNGDHMSMYGVNAGVPKTLVRYLIGYYADDKAAPATASVLRDILDTPISPELLPPDADGRIAQKTEAVVGPYELHDFYLYYAIRCGYAPRKVLMLARQAFGDAYAPAALEQWLGLFLRRFFAHQFKRSCLPDGPKVGTIALSPRGDWRMPSDATPQEWLTDLEGAED